MLTNLYLVSFLIGVVFLMGPLIGDVFGGGPSAPQQPPGTSLLSLRSATVLLLISGAVGLALDKYLELRPGNVAIVAVASGVLGMIVSTKLLSWFHHRIDNRAESQRSLHGLVAEVTVPIHHVHGGKITARRGAEYVKLLARPYHEDSVDPDTWRKVLIVDVRDGVAFVSPVPVSAARQLQNP